MDKFGILIVSQMEKFGKLVDFPNRKILEIC